MGAGAGKLDVQVRAQLSPSSDLGHAIDKVFDMFDVADAGRDTAGCGMKAVAILTDDTVPYVAKSSLAKRKAKWRRSGGSSGGLDSDVSAAPRPPPCGPSASAAKQTNPWYAIHQGRAALARYSTSQADPVAVASTRNTNHNATFFMYTMAQPMGSDGGMAKIMACQLDGVWAPVPNEDDLGQALSAFNQYYAVGLGTTPSYTHWTEPYAFAGGGELGVTVSSPIFDANTDNTLIGVVGIDADFSYMEELASEHGSRGARLAAFKALQARVQSKCPKHFGVNQCAVQSMRKASGGYPATCAGQCADFASVNVEDACLTSGELPQSLWKHQYRPGTRRKKCKTVNEEHHANGAKKLFNESSCKTYHAWEHAGGQMVDGLQPCDLSASSKGNGGASYFCLLTH